MSFELKNNTFTQIKILSEMTINRMAAGETIERPSSVIKELVENSIDANATNVDITIHNGGKNLIVITDNGEGMNQEDLYLCVERHATSKLDETDLQDINFFGFRGEALPSIGAVSRLTITSRKQGTNETWSIHINGGNKNNIIPSSLPLGTKIEVRDLFFATPARLKFLKTDQVEQNQILEIIKKIALAHSQINFSLQTESKMLFSVKNSEKDFLQSREKRIADILGKEFIENSILINSHKDDFSIQGYISLPTYNRSTSTDQFFYINNRPVKDKILSTSIKLAYQDFLAGNRYPVIVLFLTLPKNFIDVNAHPAKTEIRFKDSTLIRNFVISTLKEAIRNVGHKTANISQNAINKFQTPELKSPYFNPYSNKPSPSQIPLSFNEKKIESEFKISPYTQPSTQSMKSSTLSEHPIIDSLLKDKTLTQEFSINTISQASIQTTEEFQDKPLGDAKAQLHKNYIVSQTKHSLIIVDQHAAHERLLYEKLKADYFNKGILKQRLLVPEILELDHSLNNLFEYISQMEKLGFTIEKFGENNALIREIPALLSKINAKDLILDIVYDIEEFGTSKTADEIITHILGTMACHNSIRSGREMDKREMNELLRQMECTPHSGQCNHGRPTYIEISLEDIEKLFKRT